jgi:hypothetical protein
VHVAVRLFPCVRIDMRGLGNIHRALGVPENGRLILKL